MNEETIDCEPSLSQGGEVVETPAHAQEPAPLVLNRGTIGDPKMPPVIARAILQVKKASKALGFDDKNIHGNYQFVSIDKFYTAVGPLESEAGLLMTINEVDVTYRESGRTDREGRPVMWMLPRYDVWIHHESGVSWGPLRRHLAMPITGPQNFGAAESYIRKSFSRGLYNIPTGEKDADETAPSDSPADMRAGKGADGRPATRANPAVAAAPNPETDRARDAYKKIQRAIDDSKSAHALREVYDGALDQWGEGYQFEASLIGELHSSSLDLLKRRLQARLRAISQPPAPKPRDPLFEPEG